MFGAGRVMRGVRRRQVVASLGELPYETILLLVAFDLTGTIFLSQTGPSTRSHLDSPLRLIALTKSGRDYKKRDYTSQTWYIKNVSARDVELPLPKDRFQSQS